MNEQALDVHGRQSADDATPEAKEAHEEKTIWAAMLALTKDISEEITKVILDYKGDPRSA